MMELHPKLESRVKNGSRSSYVEVHWPKRLLKLPGITYKDKLQLFPYFNGFKDNLDTLLRC